MTVHNPVAEFVRDCEACTLTVHTSGSSPVFGYYDHANALRDAYLAERARVAQVTVARSDVEHRAGSTWPFCGCLYCEAVEKRRIIERRQNGYPDPVDSEESP